MSHCWAYHGHEGPNHWHENFPCANGKCQSPVNIVTKSALYNTSYNENKLVFKFTNEGTQCILPTHGHFQVAFKDKYHNLTGGVLGNSNEFQSEQFHFHIGQNDDEGSEHTINSHAFSSEVHFVFWNKSKYHSFSDAASASDGLAVTGFLIKKSNIDNKEFEALFNLIEQQLNNGNEIVSERLFVSLNIYNIFNQVNLCEYYTYHGSLTTPPCYESVRWIVFKDPLYLSDKQLSLLRRALVGNKRNFRPVCELHGRIIEASFHP